MKNCIYGAVIFIAACFSCTSPKAKECVVEGEVKGYGDGFFCVMTETLDDYDVVLPKRGSSNINSYKCIC